MWQVFGQNKAISFFRNSLETGKLAHAYLLVGPAGVGKMTLALNLAQALNCERSQPPCGECEPCRKIAAGKHADVQIVRLGGGAGAGEEDKPKTEIGIDQIKQIQHEINLPPFEGKYRVYIIDGAEQMSVEAANRLLKTLEEPAEKVVFVLLNANEKLLLTTIISRCQRLELPPLRQDEIEEALVSRWQVEPGRARLLSRLCRGCPGWAIHALEDDDVLRKREEQLAKFIEIVNGGYSERFAFAAEIALQFNRNRENVYELLTLWQDYWHDIMLVKAGVSESVVSIDLMDTTVTMAQAYSLAQIKDTIRAIAGTGEQLKLNANAQLALEVLMLTIPIKEKQISKAVLTGLR